MKLIFTSAARADLQSIGDAIAKENPSRAVTFVEELETRCRALLDMPLAYPLVTYRKERGIRRLVHDKYLIFYRVEADAIIILHVLAGRMNVDAILRLSE